MSNLPSGTVAAGRSDAWKWYVCVLLLSATVVNYMDRLTVNNLAVEIKQEFHLSDEEYGTIELGFGLAFAAGSLMFGILVDRIGVYWIYPVALLGWSAMGFLTGLSHTYNELLVLRIALGAFEGGHFPCGLKMVQLLFKPRDRAMGNSLLQSGTAIGAILAPQVIKALMHESGDWRLPFLVIGAGGCVWIVFWLASVRPRDLRRSAHQPGNMPPALSQLEAARPAAAPARSAEASFWELICTRRFLALAIMVVFINLNWHLFRVWLPLFLRESRGYDRDAMLDVTTFYYVAADLGAMFAGASSGWLARRGMGVFSSRMWVYGICASLSTVTTVAAMLPKGPWLMAALLVVAFGSLGCFSAYYSLTQDLSQKHQGKISGLLATFTWSVSGTFQRLFGRYLDATGDYDVAFGIMGWLPMIALIATLLLWRDAPASSERPQSRDPSPEPAAPRAG
jgi:ACS family hexuronate transporter-like MFS transporter